MTKFEWASLSIETFTLILTIVAIFVAYRQLNGWRKELSGTAVYQFANRLKLTVFKLEEAIANARAIAIFGNPDQSPRDVYEQQSFEYELRWKSVNEVLAELKLAKLESKVYLDPEIEDYVQELAVKARDLRLAISRYLGSLRDPRTFPTEEACRLNHNIVFGTGGTDDKFANEVGELVNKIINRLSQYTPK